MSQTVNINIGNASSSDIDKAVYVLLRDNFIYQDYELSESYLKAGKLTFIQLRKLCRRNNLNYALFFSRFDLLSTIVEKYNKELYGSLDRKEIIAGTRTGTADIRAIRWIIADLVARKSLYKEYGNKIKLKKIVKFLSNSKKSLPEKADYILSTTGISREYFYQKTNKKEAYKYLCGKLSESHVHVATEANNCMPQNVPRHINLSGIYIRDNFNPIIFICNEISGHPDEGLGRKIYTLVFLLVSVFMGHSFAISISKNTYSVKAKGTKDLKIIHGITNEILMPKYHFNDRKFSSKQEIITEANKLKVTPTALLVRLRGLNKLNCEYRVIKDELSDDFDQFVARNKATAAQERKLGKKGGPTPKTMYKSYQGDFVDFIKTKVPYDKRRKVFEKHVVYGRTFIDFGDL